MNEDKLKIKILENNKNEREISDEKYAPIIVKTILFGIIGTLASGVFFAIANTIINSIDKHL